MDAITYMHDNNRYKKVTRGQLVWYLKTKIIQFRITTHLHFPFCRFPAILKIYQKQSILEDKRKLYLCFKCLDNTFDRKELKY